MNQQLFVEEQGTAAGAVNLQQPASGWPVSSCLLPGVLSMQVVLEQQQQQPQTQAQPLQITQAGGNTAHQGQGAEAVNLLAS